MTGSAQLPDEYKGLLVSEFAFPGELRDLLVGGILRGAKTSTTCLLLEFELDREQLPEVGPVRLWSTRKDDRSR